MQIDQKTLARLLSMNDDQLAGVLEKIAKEAGVDPRSLGLNPESIESVRRALGSVGDTELAQLNRVYQDYRNGRSKP
jgi:hypothetical protein